MKAEYWSPEKDFLQPPPRLVSSSSRLVSSAFNVFSFGNRRDARCDCARDLCMSWQFCSAILLLQICLAIDSLPLLILSVC